MENKQECYGVVFEKEKLNNNIYLLKPTNIIKGYYLKNINDYGFCDLYGNNYYLSSDFDSYINGCEKTVYYCMTEEQLFEKYETTDVSYALECFMQELNEVMHFAKIENDENVIVTNIDMDPVIKGNDYAQTLYSQMDRFVLLDKDVIKELIKINNPDLMKDVLSSVIENTDNVDEENTKEIEFDLMTRDGFTRYFNIILNLLSQQDDRKNINLYLEKIIDSLYAVENNLKEKDIDDDKFNFISDGLYSLMEAMEEISQIEDTDIVRDELSTFYEKYSQDIIVLANLIEKYKDAEPRKIEPLEKNKNFRKSINIVDMKKYLDSKVVGQEEAKIDVISAIFRNELSENSKDRTSCLLIGPTGSGKTLIIESISEYLSRPMVIIDSTQLTMPGYIGANLEDYLLRLYLEANEDLDLAQHGIICFDEIDKKGSDKNSDVSGKGVLNTLLSFIHGTVYEIKYKKSIIKFDTSNLTIFATGAFANVAKKINDEDDKKNCSNYKNTCIGFNSVLNRSKKDDEEDINYPVITREDLVKYGEMPQEFIARLTTVSQLQGHTKDSLNELLTKSLSSPLLSEKNILSKINVDLKWTDNYLNAIINDALSLKMGGRALKTVIEKTVKKARWQALNDENVVSIVLDENTVLDNENYELIYSNGNVLKHENEEKAKKLVK